MSAAGQLPTLGCPTLQPRGPCHAHYRLPACTPRTAASVSPRACGQARASFLRQTAALRKKVHSSYQRSIANVLTKMRTMHLLEDNSGGEAAERTDINKNTCSGKREGHNMNRGQQEGVRLGWGLGLVIVLQRRKWARAALFCRRLACSSAHVSPAQASSLHSTGARHASRTCHITAEMGRIIVGHSQHHTSAKSPYRSHINDTSNE